MGGTAPRCSGCLEARNPRWALAGGGKSPLQEAPLARLASHVFPCPGLSTGGQTVQEEEDKMPGPQRCEGRGRLECLVGVGLPSGSGWQTCPLKLPCSPPLEQGCRRPGSSAKLPNRGSSSSEALGVGVGVGASQHQPFPPQPRVPSDPQPRNGRKGGAYLRLRSVWFVQRAPISAATPGSLMELLCRLRTEDRVPWAWPPQDPRGVQPGSWALSAAGG